MKSSDQSTVSESEIMKRFSQCISVLLVISMFLVIPAFAAETVSPRSSEYFAASSAYLERTTGSQFKVWFSITATDEMEVLGASTIVIQRSSDLEHWSSVKTFQMKYYPELICSNTGYHGSSVTYAGTSGYYYRALITFYAKNSEGFGELDRYTAYIAV